MEQMDRQGNFSPETELILGTAQAVGLISEKAGLMLRLTCAWIHFLAGTFALPCEWLLRRRFGVRYLGMRRNLLFFIIFVIAAIKSSNPVVRVVILAWGCLGASHFSEAWRRTRQASPWRHTYNLGSPWGPPPFGFWSCCLAKVKLPISSTLIHRYYEPLLCLLAGLILLAISAFLGGACLVGSLAMYIKMEAIMTKLRNDLWDMRDGQVRSLSLANDALGQEKPPVVFHQAKPLRVSIACFTGKQSQEAAPEPAPTPDIAQEPPEGTESRMECPACGKRLRCPRDWFGRRVRCKKCQTAFTVSNSVS